MKKQINKKGKIAVKAKKKHILEYYYMIPEKTEAKQVSLAVATVPEEKIEVWPQLNLLEVVMDADSLIFQDAWECFEDPLDLAYIQEHGFQTIYQISFDSEDIQLVKKVMAEVMTKFGGRICSDTDDFEPSYGVENVDMLGRL